jgi:ribose 5-phosphate isomerase B
MKKIFLSGDHAGFKMKEKIRDWTKLKGFEILDFGPFAYDEKDDYPDFVIPMSRALVKDRTIRGIIIAGSGEGEAIVANKIKGIRAMVYHGKNLRIVKTAREHNNANVLCLGSRFVGENEMKKAIMIFLKTKFDGGRHERRLKKFERLGGR